MQRPFVQLLGDPLLRGVDGSDVPLRAERRDQLLAYLACRNAWVTRDHVADLFWPERGQSAARSNLRYVVFQIRRASIRGFEARADSLRWQIATDVADFERAIAARDWQAALDTHEGWLLEGFELGAPPSFADWLRFERARLAALWQDALAAQLAQLRDEPDQCATLAQRALQADPLNEVALAAYMRAQLALGASSIAQRAWRAYVEGLASEHGIEPTAELRALAARLQSEPGLPETTIKPPPTDSTTVDCVGRRLERIQIGNLLGDAQCRLLTVTGPGGVGKSTLARAVLPSLKTRYAGGVAWVALEDLKLIDEVAPRIAVQIGLRLSGTDAPLAEVTRHLAAQQMLLVFDNAEHLSGFERIVETLLLDCSRLKLLVTSRARIAVSGEWLLPLDGLPVPDRDERDIEVLSSFDAVKLFELRARAMAPGFALSLHAADVVELVHTVEGLPLALELAAAWTRLLPVREIVRELTHSLDTPEAPSAANSRERSLHASFFHSWRMLVPAERQALASLSIFHSDFSHVAAAVVADASLPLLAALCDKSLLRAHGDGRFSLHFLIRQYSGQHLTDSDAVLARHADYYTRLLSRYTNYRRVEQKAALAEIQLELENCRAAWKWAIEKQDATRIEEMAVPLLFFFDTKGRWHEGIALMNEGLGAIDGSHHAGTLVPVGSRTVVATLSRALSLLQFRAGHYEDAAESARRAVELYRAAGDMLGMLAALNVGGLVLWRRGRLTEAKCHFDEALAESAGTDEIAHLTLLTGLAVVEKALGQHDRALALYERALKACRKSDAMSDAAIILHNIGNLHRALKDYASAVACFNEGLNLCDRYGFDATRVGYLLNLGLSFIELGDFERAAPVVERAAAAAQETGFGLWIMGVQFAQCRIAIARGDLPASVAHLRTGLRRARESGDAPQQVDGIKCGGRWRAARGERSLAAILFAWVAAQASEQERPEARELLAQLALSAEEVAVAEQEAAALSLNAAVDSILAETAASIA